MSYHSNSLTNSASSLPMVCLLVPLLSCLHLCCICACPSLALYQTIEATFESTHKEVINLLIDAVTDVRTDYD